MKLMGSGSKSYKRNKIHTYAGGSSLTDAKKTKKLTNLRLTATKEGCQS